MNIFRQNFINRHLSYKDKDRIFFFYRVEVMFYDKKIMFLPYKKNVQDSEEEYFRFTRIKF
jgi:hypothetical protein